MTLRSLLAGATILVACAPVSSRRSRSLPALEAEYCQGLDRAAAEAAAEWARLHLSGALQLGCAADAADAIARALAASRYDVDSTRYAALRRAVSRVIDRAMYDAALAVLADTAAAVDARRSAVTLLETMEANLDDPQSRVGYPPRTDSLRACAPHAPFTMIITITPGARRWVIRPLDAATLARGRAIYRAIGRAPTTPRVLQFQLGYCPVAG